MDKKGLILVVDDDPDIVATSRIILEGNGYEVQTASNGKEAKDLLSRCKPDLMLLDVMMASDTEGFDLAFQLKGDAQFKDLPIILLTACDVISEPGGPPRSWPTVFWCPMASRKATPPATARPE